jgi:catalase
MSTTKHFTNATGEPVADNTNIMTAGRRGPALLQDIWLIEKLAHFDREVIPERRMHAKGWGAHGTFTVTNDITRFTKASDEVEILGRHSSYYCGAAHLGELDREVTDTARSAMDQHRLAGF